MQSPGLVLGIAAGDVIELDLQDQSRFQVRKRGGNIAVQIFFPAVSDEIAEKFSAALGGVGGWLDGRAAKQLVFSVPATGDFRPLEAIFNSGRRSLRLGVVRRQCLRPERRCYAAELVAAKLNSTEDG